jgi:hypothetical protein
VPFGSLVVRRLSTGRGKVSKHLEIAWYPKHNGLPCSVFYADSLLHLPLRLITGHLPHPKNLRALVLRFPGLEQRFPRIKAATGSMSSNRLYSSSLLLPSPLSSSDSTDAALALDGNPSCNLPSFLPASCSPYLDSL